MNKFKQTESFNETESVESAENLEWARLEEFMGGVERLVSGAVRRTAYLLDFTDAADRDDLKQEALYALFEAWKERNALSDSYKRYMENLKKDNPEISDSPGVFGGYARLKMQWSIVARMNRLAGYGGGSLREGLTKTANESDLSSDEDDFDLFERLVSQTTSEAGIDEITRNEFENLFGFPVASVSAEKLREVLYETVFEEMEKNQMELSGSGSYKKNSPESKKNRKLAFFYLYGLPIIGEEGVSLLEIANKNKVAYEALKKEVQRLPLRVFTIKEQIIQAVQNKLKVLKVGES